LALPHQLLCFCLATEFHSPSHLLSCQTKLSSIEPANEICARTAFKLTGSACCRHDDSVMAVAFHPVDTRHFVSAAWNGKVRLQCANPPRVVDWKQMQLLDALPIHCMRFNRRGDKVSVGSLHGRVRQYRVLPSLKLEYHAEIGVPSPLHFTAAAVPQHDSTCSDVWRVTWLEADP
jgi:WD40 repeat protein